MNYGKYVYTYMYIFLVSCYLFLRISHWSLIKKWFPQEELKIERNEFVSCYQMSLQNFCHCAEFSTWNIYSQSSLISNISKKY